MKRKVKKYAGGMLTDSSGNPVRSSSGEPVRTRFGKDDEDRPTSSGVEDYASMGKRAGATSPFLKENISEETQKEAVSEPDSVAGKGARNLALEPDVEVKKKTVIKKKAPRYEDTKANIGNQSFAPTDAERRRQLEAADKPLESVHPESYFMPGPLGALSKLATATRISKIAPELNTVRAPMQKALEYAGSKAKQLSNEPLKLGMKKGGAVKKMSSGGKTSTASSRGDGIAQRGKTRGRIC